MNSNTNLISDLQDFMFNEENIKSYLKKRDEYYKDKLDKDKEVDAKNLKEIKEVKEVKVKPSIYFPNQQDSLYWCYYIKTYKFDTLSGIESNLANDDKINCKTFCTLCAIENINIIYIRKNTYFELLMNDTDVVYIIKEVPSQSKYVFKYGFEITTKELSNSIKDSLYRIESINKPIKCESAYKVQDLIDICSKLGIEINNNETGKKKTKKEMYESIIQYF